MMDNSIIIDSDKVERSRFIIHSHNISDSVDIYTSSFVHNSAQVYESDFVENGKQVAFSKNVDNSNNIVFSNFIIDSTNIFESLNIAKSSEIYRSTNITDSHFCSDCVDLNKSLFCHKTNGVEYFVFNKPIDERRYEFILRQYQRFEIYLNYLMEWPTELVVYTSPVVFHNFDIHYKNIAKEFWEWVINLPNYDPMVLYSITMNPKILEFIK